jgi:hypothetical protein
MFKDALCESEAINKTIYFHCGTHSQTAQRAGIGDELSRLGQL